MQQRGNKYSDNFSTRRLTVLTKERITGITKEKGKLAGGFCL
jgi:hypothetical protein